MAELTFNFIGVNAADFRRALVFYSEELGIHPAEPKPLDDADSWVMLVAGWDESSVSGRRGLRCELFGRDVEPPPDGGWGGNQNVRPIILVADLSTTMAALRDRGVPFTGPIEHTSLGQFVEFRAPDGVRWSLAQTPDMPAGQGMETPFLGFVELKAADVDSQLDFYTRVMGLTVGEQSASRVRLEQGIGNPWLLLKPSGERVTGGPDHHSPFDVQPVWMSFETPDISEAKAWLMDQDVPLLRDVQSHEWAGTDLLISDADGNPLQVVEYEER